MIKITEGLQRFSYSKLSTANNCMLEFIMRYLMGEESADNCYSQYGTFIHHLLDRWAKGTTEIYQLITEYEDEYENYVTEPFPRLRNGKDSSQKYFDEGYEFLSGFTGLPEEYIIVEAEKKFDIQIEDFIFNGIVDLILKDKDDNYVILDWKSKGGFKSDEEEAEYRRQLYLYSHYIKEEYGAFPIKTVFYCFREQKIYEREFDIDAYNESMKWMFDTVKKIRQFYCKYDYFYCNTLCGFRYGCPLKVEVESNKSLQEVVKKEKQNEKGRDG